MESKQKHKSIQNTDYKNMLINTKCKKDIICDKNIKRRVKQQSYCVKLKSNCCQYKIDCYNYRMLYVSPIVTTKKISIEDMQEKIRK